MQHINDNNIPLVADLDGTIIKTDILYESLMLLIKKNPFYLFLIPFWLIKGKSFIKQMAIERVKVDFKYLPYNDDVLDYIKVEKSKGRKIYLATAANEIPAKEVFDYLNIFDGYFASTKNHNLLAKNKTKKLNDEFGVFGFDYIGDSKRDIHVWQSARYAIMVNPDVNVKNAISKEKILKIFDNKPSKISLIIKQVRVYQWVKNLLIFLPLLMAHRFFEIDLYLQAFYAFLGFSFTASFVYVLNDLLDLESDRKHPRKKNRPVASGNLQVREAIIILPFLLIFGFAISSVLSINFVLLLLSYLILTSAYSFILKKHHILDILVLSSLYTVRLIGGAIAVDVRISPWLLAFSFFIFLSLAIVKRYTEIRVMIQENKEKAAGRGYLTSDESLLSSFGIGSGLIAVLVFFLYAQSPEIQVLYTNHELFYGITPFLLYWIMRIWFKAHRGELNDDPVVYTVKDSSSYIVILIIIILIIGAII